MALFEDKGPSLSGNQQSNFLAEAMVESEHFRADYATLPNVIKAEDMPWERSPDGLIKHLVNKKMHTRECCIEAYMQFLKDGERSGKHRHMWEELFFVVEGAGYDLHWDLKWDCLEAFEWEWASEARKFEWTVGDYVYIPPFTMHQHFAKAGEECRIIVMSNRIVKDMGFDWYDQVERAPGF
jgi:quercetin dioxygenase-like cupin family protein